MPLHNLALIPAEEAINHIAGVDIPKEIDDDRTDGDKEHQIRDAFISVFEAKPFEPAAQ